ncbi:hypothetical protein Poli38472_000614 [Pythium oligandrum]|uniref:Uncharacterized protein n=1 Tax=Pythium oligandrum TaxID=41045 RepID=A0A8K1FI99_PYTOL|nr:hypothetical protein Poli38472_000614 [Pythium oligandrum]|eukprot:TMW60572.1 hypothetical protein Poli38472_000614 [Pythium oligandrum]
MLLRTARRSAGAASPPTTQPVSVPRLLQAMARWMSLYMLGEVFFGPVADEYAKREDVEVPIEVLQEKEREMRELALAASDPVKARELKRIPPDMIPYLDHMLIFYRTVGVLNDDALGEDAETARKKVSSSQEPAPLSPTDSHAGHTDGSGGESPSPVLDDHGDVSPSHDDMNATAATNACNAAGHEKHDEANLSVADENMITAADRVEASELRTEAVEVMAEAEPPEAMSFVQVAAPDKRVGAKTAGKRPRKRRLTDQQIYTVMSDLVRDCVEAKKYCREQELLYEQEHKALTEKKAKYKALKQKLRACKEKGRERRRLQLLVEGQSEKAEPEDKSVKKERKRFKQYKRELDLRFKLMESENQRYKMEIENKLAELLCQVPLALYDAFSDVSTPSALP